MLFISQVHVRADILKLFEVSVGFKPEYQCQRTGSVFSVIVIAVPLSVTPSISSMYNSFDSMLELRWQQTTKIPDAIGAMFRVCVCTHQSAAWSIVTQSDCWNHCVVDDHCFGFDIPTHLGWSDNHLHPYMKTLVHVFLSKLCLIQALKTLLLSRSCGGCWKPPRTSNTVKHAQDSVGMAAHRWSIKTSYCPDGITYEWEGALFGSRYQFG